MKKLFGLIGIVIGSMVLFCNTANADTEVGIVQQTKPEIEENLKVEVENGNTEITLENGTIIILENFEGTYGVDYGVVKDNGIKVGIAPRSTTMKVSTNIWFPNASSIP